MNSGVEIVLPFIAAAVVCCVVGDCANAGTLNSAQAVARANVSFMTYYSFIVDVEPRRTQLPRRGVVKDGMPLQANKSR
jgi:hypothetical protein